MFVLQTDKGDTVKWSRSSLKAHTCGDWDGGPDKIG